MLRFRFISRAAAGLIAACVMGEAANAAPLTCRWTAKQQCDAGTPCRTIPASVWTTVDKQTQRYQRCDRKGCDSYTAVVTVGPGAFTVYDLIGRGVFLKMEAGGGATEIVSLGHSVLISHGTCR